MIDSLWRVRMALPLRQVTLFLLAVVVPSIVLVVMAAWMTAQERELAHKHVIDERQRQTEEIRQSLLGYLEGLKLQQVTTPRDAKLAAPQPPIALAARIDGRQLVLPWDEPGFAAPPILDHALADAIRQGEQLELIARQAAAAAAQYRRAVALARSAAEQAYARLLAARAWTKAARSDRAREEYVRLLGLPSEVRDEHGVPIWAYAAQHLAANGTADLRSTIVARIETELQSIAQAAPTTRYLLRDLLDVAQPADARGTAPAASGPLRPRLDQAIRFGEQAAVLQTAFPLEGLREGSASGPRWVLFGDIPWLVSTASGADPILVAVPADAAVRTAVTRRVSNVRLLPADSADGEWIGEGFAGMKIAYTATAGDDRARGGLQRWFAWLIVLFSLTVTSFGGYFLWRDVRREMRMAALRSQFVSSVSHELKTPLTAIRMFAETLRLGRASSEEIAAEYLDTIVNESERLTRLLNNVLEFSKMERGATHFRLQPTPLEEPIRRVLRAMNYPLEQQGFRLDVQVDDSLPRVLIDADAIEQALLNLLANAMKYSGTARDIALHVRSAAGGIEILVVDHGIGITPADQARVFEKFYRASTPENRHIPGTGLGLTLVDHIARAHGGSVRVTSAPGQGSTFALLLPAAAGGTGSAPSMAQADAV